MKEFWEAMALCVVIAFLCLLMFVFTGSPDLFDKWRERAMKDASGECVHSGYTQP